MWHIRQGRRHESNEARRTGDLAGKNSPKSKTSHMDAHKDRKHAIVDAIKSPETEEC
jgi:hypothetical protein